MCPVVGSQHEISAVSLMCVYCLPTEGPVPGVCTREWRRSTGDRAVGLHGGACVQRHPQPAAQAHQLGCGACLDPIHVLQKLPCYLPVADCCSVCLCHTAKSARRTGLLAMCGRPGSARSKYKTVQWDVSRHASLDTSCF